MNEKVIFHDPENVNILANRSGEIVQIPGTDFRTPVAPYTSMLMARFDNYINRNIEISISTYSDVTVIPLGLYELNTNYWGDPVYKMCAKIKSFERNAGRGIQRQGGMVENDIFFDAYKDGLYPSEDHIQTLSAAFVGCLQTSHWDCC